MKHVKHLLQFFSLFLLFSLISSFVIAKNQLAKLVCEYHINPIGIDEEKPRLSWQILSEEENVKQTAYEIRVADSPANLSKKSSLIWTSGKVTSTNRLMLTTKGQP